jgi:hypothetical protein
VLLRVRGPTLIPTIPRTPATAQSSGWCVALRCL